MIKSGELLVRHIVPRWRSVSSTIAAAELSIVVACNKTQPAQTTIQIERFNTEFLDKLEQWQYDHSIASAEELIATAVVSGITASRFLEDVAQQIASTPDIALGSKRMALGFLHRAEKSGQPILSHETDIRAKIHQHKKALSLAPRDSLLLTETALLLTTLGPSRAAKTLMRRAVALTPLNRYVFRSAIRFFIHTGDIAEATSLAQRYSAIADDPWLLSASLAAADAANESPHFFKQAKKLLSNESFCPFDLSELAGAIATLHLSSGNIKLARKVFRQSLENPTENAVAQAEWAQRKDNAISITEQSFSTPRAFEAIAWNAYRKHHWEESLEAAQKWIELEPFNSSPFIHASFIATSLSNQLDTAIAITKRGLLANPHDSGLYNNEAVAEAYKGELEAAENSYKSARKYSKTPSLDVTLNATAGLISFRKNEVEKGIDYYIKAYEIAKELKLHVQQLRVVSYFANEMTRYDTQLSIDLISKVERRCKEIEESGAQPPPDVKFLVDKIKTSPVLALGRALEEPYISRANSVINRE